jgi:hypothetical protein
MIQKRTKQINGANASLEPFLGRTPPNLHPTAAPREHVFVDRYAANQSLQINIIWQRLMRNIASIVAVLLQSGIHWLDHVLIGTRAWATIRADYAFEGS